LFFIIFFWSPDSNKAEMLLDEQLAQGGTAVGTGLNTKKGYVCFFDDQVVVPIFYSSQFG